MVKLSGVRWIQRQGWRQRTELVVQDDRTVGGPSPILSLLDESLIIGVNVRGGDIVGPDPPVVRVLVPDDCRQVESLGDDSDTVVDVSERRSPAFRGDSENVLDDLSGVVKLGKGNFVGERGHVLVRPGVDANLVAVLQPSHSLQRPVDDVGPDVEPAVRGHNGLGNRINVHGRFLVVLIEQVVQGVVAAVGSVVKAQPPSLRLWDRGDVRGQTGILRRSRAAPPCPPTVRVGVVVDDASVVAIGGTLGGDLRNFLVHGRVDRRENRLSLGIPRDDPCSLPDGRELVLDVQHGLVAVRSALLCGIYGGISGHGHMGRLETKSHPSSARRKRRRSVLPSAHRSS